jgi:competence protein ComFB
MEYKLTNIAEQLVWQEVDAVLEQKTDACKCNKCRADIAAYALNKVKPHYVVSRQGEVLARTQSLQNVHRVGLLVAITEAVEIVAANPRHE